MTENKDNRKGYWISSDEIKKRLEEVKQKEKDLEKQEEFYLYVVSTPTGKITVKSKLPYKEWMAKYNAKKPKQEKKYFKSSNI
jgi:hypothetical protein